MSGKPIHPRLAGAAPPAPPQRLRAAALAAAERSWDAPRPDVWTRLWESRPARLAWAAAVLALVAGHVLVSTSETRFTASERRPLGTAPATLAAHAAPELDEIAGALRLRITRRTWVGEGPSRAASARPVAVPPLSKEPS